MQSYEIWKLCHVLGLLLLFGSLGGSAALSQTRGGASEGAARFHRILHGIALLVMLVAGFGLLATLNLHAPGSWPAWVWIKLVIWLLLGASPVLIRRAERHAGVALIATAILGAVAAWAALHKPGM